MVIDICFDFLKSVTKVHAWLLSCTKHNKINILYTERVQSEFRGITIAVCMSKLAGNRSEKMFFVS